MAIRMHDRMSPGYDMIGKVQGICESEMKYLGILAL